MFLVFLMIEFEKINISGYIMNSNKQSDVKSFQSLDTTSVIVNEKNDDENKVILTVPVDLGEQTFPIEKEVAKENLTIKLTEDEQKVVEDLKSSFDVKSTTNMLTFGVPAQQSVAQFADKLLSKIKSKDSGSVGVALNELINQLNSIDLEQIKKSQSFWGKLPILGIWLRQGVKVLLGDLESVKTKVSELVGHLQAQEQLLLKDITMFDAFYNENLGFIKNLELYIVAGEKIVAEMRESALLYENKYLQTNDPLDAQHYKDLKEQIELFSKRLHNLSLTRLSAIQTCVNVRVAQQADKILINDINDILNNTLMLWKSQFVIAIGLMHTEKALKTSKSIKDFTNAQYINNAKTLNQLIDSLKENYERGVLDIATLEEVNKLTINSIEKSVQMYKEAQQKRALAETSMIQMEQEIKQSLYLAKSM